MNFKYPHLFNDMLWPWGPMQVKFTILENLPSPAQIAHVNVVPYLDNKWVMVQLDDASWEIPGGTLEAGETYIEALKRELLEEVGSKLVRYALIEAWHCHSLAARPYRSHLPHPEFYRLVMVGEVSFIGVPRVTAGSELVKKVQAVPLEVVVERFKKQGRPELSELYQLADELIRGDCLSIIKVT